MLRSVGVALALAASLGCGPQFSPFWLIEPDPSGPDGQLDPSGKLRVLALRADPPEARPGELVTVRALAVTHPQQGAVVTVDGVSRHTPQPLGLTALWFACREPQGAAAPEPCGLGQSGPSLALAELPSLPLAPIAQLAGPATQLVLPSGPTLPYTQLVTLVVADQAQPGGAQGCYEQALGSGGVVSSPNHCVVAIKRIRVSASAQPNRNPEIGRLLFGPSSDQLTELGPGGAAGAYPLLDPATGDDERPHLTLAVERAADAVEVGSDSDGNPQNETLSATFLTTGGTLEAGRGTFLDLDCADNPQSCRQSLRSDISWQPPAARAAVEAPEQLIYFFAVLRDDRGGLSVASASVGGR